MAELAFLVGLIVLCVLHQLADQARLFLDLGLDAERLQAVGQALRVAGVRVAEAELRGADHGGGGGG